MTTTEKIENQFTFLYNALNTAIPDGFAKDYALRGLVSAFNGAVGLVQEKKSTLSQEFERGASC